MLPPPEPPAERDIDPPAAPPEDPPRLMVDGALRAYEPPPEDPDGMLRMLGALRGALCVEGARTCGDGADRICGAVARCEPPPLEPRDP